MACDIWPPACGTPDFVEFGDQLQQAAVNDGWVITNPSLIDALLIPAQDPPVPEVDESSEDGGWVITNPSTVTSFTMFSLER